MSDFTLLHQTLNQRPRPEDVVELLLPLLRKQLTRAELALLERAAASSVRKNTWHYSSMPTEFVRPVGAARQARKAAELFAYPLPATDQSDFSQPAQVAILLGELSPRLGKTVGNNNYRTDRLDRAGRTAAGLRELSRRRYNKLFRGLRHLEAKLERLSAAERQREFQLVSKHSFAHEITAEDLERDLFSAAFVAYYTARCNLRSEFTISGQQRPYDKVADMLFRRCRGPQNGALRRWLGAVAEAEAPANPTNWPMLAQVYPAPEVLAHLTDEQKGQLLGRWTALLTDLAEQLRVVWAAGTFRRESMVVKRGDDSSTWNVTAGAWNKARDNWLNLLHALGLEWVLDDFCPGKVLRLMAADVVQWHRSTGGQLDPNTQVWAALPLPWEVLGNTTSCGRTLVAAACQAAGLDPEKSGWLAPRPHGIAPLRPTPELVHGVSISNPYLALILRQNKVFSGKQQFN